MSTRTVKFLESLPLGDGFRLDKEAGIAYGVSVCGKHSLNGRDYPDDVRDRDKAVYEGVDCFIDHAEGDGNRRVREWFGKIKNPRTRVSDKKTIGDLHYPLKSTFTEEFIERCERFPSSFAMSHVATCKTKREKGRERIESIAKVHSVDLVMGAATNDSIFESIKHPGTVMKLTEYVAAGLVKFAGSKGFTALKEMGDLPMDMPTDAPVIDDATSDADPVKAAFVTAMKGLVDQYDSGDITDAELMSKFKDVLKAHVKLSGKEAPKEEPAEPAEESKKLTAKLAQLTVENIALKAGVTLTPLQTKAALALDDSERSTLIESFKVGKAGEKPTSGESQHGGNRTVKESATDAPPTDGKKYAERLNSRD